MPRAPDAIVVGGGLIGCLVARALADDGRRVTLFERGAELGGKASTAAAGMLSPQMEWAEDLLVEGEADVAGRTDAMLELGIAARERWPAFAAALEAETGRRIHYRDEGTLVVALTDVEAAELADRAAAQRRRGLRAEWLDPDRVRELEPGIAATARGALHIPDDRQVDPLALMAAAAEALARRPDVRVEIGSAVRAIESAAGRVTGVTMEAGAEAAAHSDLVVLAAGAWSGGIAGLPRPLPVRPVKGQMAALKPAAMPIRHVVGGRGAYCVPRDDGRVVVGATVEDAGFDERVDPAAVAALIRAAAAAVPALGDAPVASRWSGLRPGTADDLPILGADPELPGLLYATGHYRNGILLAPLTAEVVAALARGAEPPVETAPFSPARAALEEPASRK
ncbi:MAG TPA: glycine oxidase ThiO [Gemmatimonadota bacterium]|nr:glycine oxidase ThiO [Gemmatimonadota bacterium]